MYPPGSIYLLLRIPGELCISDPIKTSWSSADSSVLRRPLIKKRATTILIATSHCIIFHTVNMASTCQGPAKFRTLRWQPNFQTQAKCFHVKKQDRVIDSCSHARHDALIAFPCNHAVDALRSHSFKISVSD